MFVEILEQDFLSISNCPIQYIGIYELDWLLDDNQLDCEGIIIAFDDRKIMISTKAIGEDDFEFVYYDFSQEYECRKILSTPSEPIIFIRKEEEEESFRVLRFQIGIRPILATACEDHFITIGISHWDINDEWLEFDNNFLLNDQQN